MRLDEIFLSEAGMGDGWGRVPQHKIMRQMAAARDEAVAAAEAEEQRRQEAELAKIKSTPAYKRRMKLIEQLLTSEKPPVMPYQSLFAVFNPKNLWFNVNRRKKTPLSDPREVSYDFERGFEDFAWLPLIQPGRRGVGAEPVAFYPARGLASRMSEDRVEELQNEVTDELEAGIVNYRNALNYRTKMAPAMRSPILDVLIAQHDLDLTARIEQNGWNYRLRRWRKDPSLIGYRNQVGACDARCRRRSTRGRGEGDDGLPQLPSGASRLVACMHQVSPCASRLAQPLVRPAPPSPLLAPRSSPTQRT